MFQCLKCNREFKNLLALQGHKAWCKCNKKPSMLGRKHSFETRAKMSYSAVERYKDNNERIKTSQAMKIALNNPEIKAKFKGGNKGHHHSEETKKILSMKSKIQWERDKDRLLQIVKENASNPGSKEKISNTLKKYYKDNPVAKLNLANKTKVLWQNKEFRNKMHNIHTSPEWKNKMQKVRVDSLKFKPNKSEMVLLNILHKLYPNEWKFVGDGQVIIAGKCPDFINVNGKKLIIELFGDYWHRGQNPNDRINIFKPYGYETLIIWEKELKDIPVVEQKLRRFVNV
jgi:hypothetical protein